jgi:NAD(P)-dependent dehydrogenase (short-subunit alcohol dehydrogenase family)
MLTGRTPTGRRSLGSEKAVRWGKRGARINTISPGIVMTPLAKDKLSGRVAPAIGG